MRFNANYQTDIHLLNRKISDFLENNGLSGELLGGRYGLLRLEYLEENEENTRWQQMTFIYNPEREELGGYKIFRCTVSFHSNPAPADSTPTDPIFNVAAYAFVSEYEYLVTGLQEVLDQTFPIVYFSPRTIEEVPSFTVAQEVVSVSEIEGNTIEETSELEQATPNLPPWGRIPDNSWHRQAVMLWWQGNECSEISEIIHVSEKTIRNIFARYRSNPQYGEEVVPLVKDLRKKGIR